MNWTTFARDYLTFSRRERIGIIITIALILLLLFFPGRFSKQEAAELTITEINTNEDTTTGAHKKFEASENAETTGLSEENDPVRSGVPDMALFFFDPNTIGEHEWKKLGLRDKTIRTISNYVAKGGHFKAPEDLKRIYG